MHLSANKSHPFAKMVADSFLYKYKVSWSILAILSLGKNRDKDQTERETVREREIDQNEAICGGLYFPARRDRVGRR